jgi:site-specific DNA-methyltransferase (adenine-specific)
LPHRLIQLYSFKGDVILGPFCGSGTACLSALKDERHYIGYDINQEYVDLANRRIQEVINKPKQKKLFQKIKIPKQNELEEQVLMGPRPD